MVDNERLKCTTLPLYTRKTDIDEAKVISARQHKSKFNFELFWKIFFFEFHTVVATREDLSIDVSITNVGLILTKLRRFQLFSTSQNSISNFFEKKKKSIFWVSML